MDALGIIINIIDNIILIAIDKSWLTGLTVDKNWKGKIVRPTNNNIINFGSSSLNFISVIDFINAEIF